MQESTEPIPLPMCTSCGSLQEVKGHFCEKCGAPMTQHANSDYILGIQSRGFALHKATHDPKNGIVVLGTWMWVGPSFALALFLFVLGLVTAYQDSAIGGRILAAFGAAGVLLFGTILYRTTTAWLEQRTGARRTVADEANDRDSEPEDHVDCLECGKSFAARLPGCPACGWTYRVESPGDEKAKEE